MAEDESALRRKLLIDGDGSGDNRRIELLMKQFVKWSNLPSTTSEDESKTNYDKILQLLAQCETGMVKSQYIRSMNNREINNYDELYKRIGERIADANETIKSCKQELEQAKQIRKNKQEYNALAKIIKQHPDRQETMKKLAESKLELQSIQTSRDDIDEKLEMRRKQFHVLLNSINELQQMLDGGDENTSDMISTVSDEPMDITS